MISCLKNFHTFRLVSFWFWDDENDTNGASALYWACEMKCRRLTKRFLCYGCIHLSTFLPVLITVLWDNFHSEFDESAYNFPFNVAVPFNLQSISGWLLAWFYQFNECFSYGVQMITTTTCFTCFCYYIIAMCNHFGLIIESIRSDSQEILLKRNMQNYHQMWLNTRAKLQRSIEMHIDIHE